VQDAPVIGATGKATADGMHESLARYPHRQITLETHH
jgi:hypothetical protein